MVLLWDGLSAHWSYKMRAHLDQQRDRLTEVADQAQHGIQRVCASDSLVLGFLAQLARSSGRPRVKFVQDVAAAAS